MSAQLNDSAWITLMHELQSFVRSNLEKPEVMSEVRQLMAPSTPGRLTLTPRLAADQIVRAFELLAPALMVDFLAEHREFLNQRALAAWAEEREGLHDMLTQLRA
jgi:hypothetical protein